MTALHVAAREQRVLVTGVLGIAVIIAGSRGLPAWQQWNADVHASAVELAQDVERARASVAHSRATRDSLAVRQRRFIALAPLLLRGQTSAAGSATIASLISTVAMAANVRLGPVQVDADTASRRVFNRVVARAQVTGDVRGVGTFLGAIERGPMLLAVRALSISQLEPAAAPDRAEALRVDLTVEGLMLAPPRANAAARGDRPLGARSARSPVVVPVWPHPVQAAEPRRPVADSVARNAAYMSVNDPFRLSHQPATVAYAPALEGLAPPPVARPPRPTFVLRGIVGGPPWSALVDGVPGHDGSALLRTGDSVATLVVRAVRRDTVIIEGADTTWRLTVKRAW